MNRQTVRTIKPRKSNRQRAIKINMTLPPVLVPVLDRIVSQKGFSGPVDYFKSRVRLDGGLTLSTDA